MNTIHNWDTWIGTDEAGKGDYFGPLVVAAFYVDADCRETLSDLGVADGKTLSNRRVRDLAERMHHRYEQRIVVVERMPEAYNSLYNDFRRPRTKLKSPAGIAPCSSHSHFSSSGRCKTRAC